MQRLAFWRHRRHAIPRWLRTRMLSLRALTTEREAAREARESERVREARAAVEDARARAEYHGWSGTSGNAYARAQDELLAALQEQDDTDPAEGRGAAGWAILSMLILIGVAVGEFTAHMLR